VQEQRLAEAAVGRTRGVVIPLGVDDDLLASAGPSQRFRERIPGLGQYPYVLSLSRMHPKKQLDLLVDVFLDATADDALRDWRLVLAGDGPADYVSGLRRLVAERKAEHRVLFPGWIGGEDRAELLRGAALMALPSHQENFGLAVVESLACGVPVLISSGVNLAEEISAAEAGWVAPLDRGALALALREALSTPEQRERRGARGYELARTRFTWSPIAERLMELYASISGWRSQPR
jgi:glycosyltransferase involved in cell wall biosynthesis